MSSLSSFTPSFFSPSFRLFPVIFFTLLSGLVAAPRRMRDWNRGTIHTSVRVRVVVLVVVCYKYASVNSVCVCVCVCGGGDE